MGQAESALATALERKRQWLVMNFPGGSARQRTLINRLLEDFKGHVPVAKLARLAKRLADAFVSEFEKLTT